MSITASSEASTHEARATYCAQELKPIKKQEGPSTQYLRTLVPKAIKGKVFGTRVLKILGTGSQSFWETVQRTLRLLAQKGNL